MPARKSKGRPRAKRKYTIRFNLKPYRYREVRGRRVYETAAWPLRFDSREDAENYMRFVSPQVFANARLPDGRRIVSASVEPCPI